MRAYLLMAAVLVHPAWTPADERADRERKVRVALALAAAAGQGCGKCRSDVEQVRADAQRDKRPIALFVGGCESQLGGVAETAGAIPAKAAVYPFDGRDPAAKRIVIIEPKADGSGFMVAATLPAAADPKELTMAVKAATPKPAAPDAKPKVLDWSR